jgi:hypothetical protein
MTAAARIKDAPTALDAEKVSFHQRWATIAATTGSKVAKIAAREAGSLRKPAKYAVYAPYVERKAKAKSAIQAVPLFSWNSTKGRRPKAPMGRA